MYNKLKEKLDQALETPDLSWSQLQPQQEPENWEKLLGIHREYEGMDKLLFTENGDIRHINGYTQGK